MKLYAILKLKGINTLKQFFELNRLDSQLFLGDIHFVMPGSNKGITLSFANVEGYFEEEDGTYLACFTDLDKTWKEKNHNEGFTELSYELLKEGYVDEYHISFNDFTDVQMLNLYCYKENEPRIILYDVSKAVNLA